MFAKSRRKKMGRSESLSTDRAGQPVPKPRRLIGAVVETETQEISADFSDVPDKSDDEAVAATSDQLAKIDEAMWKPGSLIPAKISAAVFG